jgi:hypothetical protein
MFASPTAVTVPKAGTVVKYPFWPLGVKLTVTTGMLGGRLVAVAGWCRLVWRLAPVESHRCEKRGHS